MTSQPSAANVSQSKATNNNMSVEGRKRELILDEVKSIREEIIVQLRDTADIIMTLDLAPPTKYQMYWNETGGVEQLLTLPGRRLHSRILLNVYQRNINPSPVDGMDSKEESEDNMENYSFGNRYLHKMGNLIEALKAALTLNLSRQEEIDELMEIRKPNNQPNVSQSVIISKKSHTVFCSPYFKDFHLYSPPQNEDTIKKKEGSELDVYSSSSTIWTESDKKYLNTAVRGNALMKIPLYRQWAQVMEVLVQKRRKIGTNVLYGCNFFTTAKDLEKQIAMADNKLKNIANLKERCIFNDRDENFNWMKISLEEFHGLHSAKSCELQWKNQIHPSLNKSAWSHDEDKLLMTLAEITGGADWSFIASQLGTDRTPISCMQRYARKLNLDDCKKRWDKSEDEMLLKLVKEHRINNLIPWMKIACHMEGRTKDQCWMRYFMSLREDIRRGLFTEEEDMLLIAGVEMYGTDWSNIGKHFTSRTPNQLFSRWNAFLKPDFQNWTPEEDSRLLQLVLKYGEKDWLKISKEMRMERNVTNAQAMNRFKTLTLKLGKLDVCQHLKLRYPNKPGLSSVRQNKAYRKTRETFESWSETYEFDELEEIDDQNINRSFLELFNDVSNLTLQSFMRHVQGLLSSSTNEITNLGNSETLHRLQLPGSSVMLNPQLSQVDAQQMTMASQCINKIGEFPSIKMEDFVSNQAHQENALSNIPEVADSIKKIKNEKRRIPPDGAREGGQGLELEILNISSSDYADKGVNLTLIPPNQASLMGFREILLERRKYENLTLGDMLKDQQSQRMVKPEETKSSAEEPRSSQTEADILLSRRFLKLFLLPAKMSVDLS